VIQKTGTILVADDDAAIRTVVGQALTRAGYEVRTAGNAAALWKYVQGGEGDLIVTDVMMPRECLRSHSPDPEAEAANPHRGDERPEHIHDRDQGFRARSL
jgi:CheY-like chemotaxis protein